MSIIEKIDNYLSEEVDFELITLTVNANNAKDAEKKAKGILKSKLKGNKYSYKNIEPEAIKGDTWDVEFTEFEMDSDEKKAEKILKSAGINYKKYAV